MGQPVLPAVEAMEILAATVRREDPAQSVTTITNARFDKFLPLDINQHPMSAFANVAQLETGGLQMELATKTKAPMAAITRTKIHAQLTFEDKQAGTRFVPLDVAAAPEGVCYTVDADKIYAELVPFGPTYRNIKGPVWLSPEGALAAIQSPDRPTASGTNLLGAPFALDAAFHAACVWGQHIHNVVAFPVAIDQRVVYHPTQPNTRYYARVIPRSMTTAHFSFDLWLLDETGQVCEMIQGLKMRDVSGGRIQPPAWIVRTVQSDPLAGIRSACRQLAIVELEALAPYAPAALSPFEAERLTQMAPRRQKSYLSARVALKQLSRRLQNNDDQTDPQTITTVCEDRVKPCCPLSHGERNVYCSASHDARFAIAVAADQPVGIDVEMVSDKAVKCSSIYMSEQESALIVRSPLGDAQAATRIWSLKEAIAKASGMGLATAWRCAQVRSIGEHETRFDLDGKRDCSALHATVGKHLFTFYSHSNQ